jgi:hypothetical protein
MIKKIFWKREKDPTLAKINPAPSSHVNTVVKYNKEKARGGKTKKKEL